MQSLFQTKGQNTWQEKALKSFKIALSGVALSGLLIACGAPATQSGNSAAQATVAPTATTASSSTVSSTTATSSTNATTSTTTSSNTTQAGAAATMTKFNLNTVTPDQILTIPNAGNRMVREFQEYRPYTSILQFRKEIGKYVDQAQVAEYEKYVYVPVSPNDADAATLQQLPGVDETIANQLIASRPYASDDAFLQALATHVSAEQAASAQAYLETK